MADLFSPALDELIIQAGTAQEAFDKARHFFISDDRILQLTHALLAVCIDAQGGTRWTQVSEEIKKFASHLKIQIENFKSDDLQRLVMRATRKSRNESFVPICGLYIMAKVQIDEELRDHHAIKEAISFQDFVTDARETFFGGKDDVVTRSPEKKSAAVSGLRNVLGADSDLERRGYYDMFSHSDTRQREKAFRQRLYFVSYRRSSIAGKIRKTFLEISTPASKSLDYFEFRNVYVESRIKRVATGPILRLGDTYYLIGGSGKVSGDTERNLNDGIKIIAINSDEFLNPHRHSKALYMSHDKTMKPIVGRMALVRLGTPVQVGMFTETDVGLNLIDSSLLRDDLELLAQAMHSDVNKVESLAKADQLQMMPSSLDIIASFVDAAEKFIRETIEEPNGGSIESGPVRA